VYKIEFSSQAVKSFRKIPHDTAILIREKIEFIAKDPFANIPNATRLQGRPGFRLRVGDWRIIYEINQEKIVIVVLKIAPRGEVYK
jgi:mRNA interferase RelE/StbE